jgi:hypothetical protein
MKRDKKWLSSMLFPGLEPLAYVQYRYSWADKHGLLQSFMVLIGLDHV